MHGIGARAQICRGVGVGRTKMFPTETWSARLLLYQIDLISVDKSLDNITCVISHIINLYRLYARSYMNGLIYNLITD